ncbi:uncharacterized protein LOC141601318 [Silene latifolia]|uniref:uncharacterized protein LOC141601318 n=1 Tax=Silene latifolia TaxID=37657 RepID=UPI003D78006E
MRQRRWIELIRDYDIDIVYYEGKSNVVADAINRKSMSLCTALSMLRLKEEVKKIGIHVIRKGDLIGNLTLEPELYDVIREKQASDVKIQEWKGWDYQELKKGNNMIWVIVDRLTKLAYFITMKDTWSKVELSNAYCKYVVKLHGFTMDIVSDRDSRLISRFWQELQSSLGTQLKMNMAFHPAMDGQTERTIQTLEDMLTACILEFGGS